MRFATKNGLFHEKSNALISQKEHTLKKESALVISVLNIKTNKMEIAL